MSGISAHVNLRKKQEKFKDVAQGLALDDYESDYGNLIKINCTTTMEIERLRTLATGIFKTINNINPSYIKDIFTPKTNAKIRPHDIIDIIIQQLTAINVSLF